MKDMKGEKTSKEKIRDIEILENDILKTKEIKYLKEFEKTMKIIEEKAEAFNISLIQKFIILFYSHYNQLESEKQNKNINKLIELSIYMIDNFQKENILYLIQTYINTHFSNEFKNYKIFADKSKKNDSYEICFSIIILSKNIKLMSIFFTEYLKVSEMNKEKLLSLNLENPFTAKLFDSLFQKIYEKIKMNQSEDFSSIISNCKEDSNISLFKMFRCSKCYDIMMMKINKEKNIEMKCSVCDNEYKKYTESDIRMTILSNFYCATCNNTLNLYEENYKCTRCKSLLCSNCKSGHFKKCFCLKSIKLYEIGYKCESHNCKYIDYCFFCKKNLCKICKSIHPHKVKEITNIDNIILKFLKNYNSSKRLNNGINGEITKNLSFIYLDRKKNVLFNGYMYEILCELLNIDLNDRKKDIYFKKFNDEQFQVYYSELYQKISEGNLYYLKSLNSIKSHYTQNNIIMFEYDNLKIIERENDIQQFIKKSEFIWARLDDIHRFNNYDHEINDLIISNNSLKLNIDELNAKLLIWENSYRIQQESTHNILCRFLVDELLQSIIVLYHDKLDNIGLNLNIFLDLISHSNYDIFSNTKILNKISNISNDFSVILNEFRKNPFKEGLKDKLYNIICSPHKILFKDDIIIKEEIFKKEDLNKILDILFFIKSIGNITAYPNIDKDESLKMNIQKLPLKFEIDSFYNSKLKSKVEKEIEMTFENETTKIDDKLLGEIDEEDIYYHLNKFNIELGSDFNLFDNLKDYRNGLKDDITEKITEIRDNLLLRFNIGKIKGKINIEEIIESLFNDKDEVIFEASKVLIKTLLQDTDNVIKKYLSIDIEKKLANKNNNINDLIQTLKLSKLMLSNFIELNIPKDNNLGEYIKELINNPKINYYNNIMFVENFKKFYFDKKYLEIEYRKKEIIAQICFLLLQKTYENETQFLKTIKKNYEREKIKNLIYEEIDHRLDGILQEFQKGYTNNSFNLTNLIKKIFFNETDDLAFNNIKNILSKIATKIINLDDKAKMNIDSQLFYVQNSD